METTKNKTSQYLTKIEINDWLNWLKKNNKWRYYLLVKLGISTLLRYSDLNRLCWNDLLDKEILFLNEKKTNKKREIRIERDIQETIKYVFNRLNDGYTDKLFPYHINSVNSYLKKSFEKLLISKYLNLFFDDSFLKYQLIVQFHLEGLILCYQHKNLFHKIQLH